MRRTLTLCRTALAGAAVAVLLTACGGGSSNDSASSGSATTSSSSSSSSSAAAAGTDFCQKAGHLVDQIQNADINTEDLSQIGPFFQQAAAGIRSIDPPAEIAQDWNTLADGIEQLGNAAADTDFKDPAQAAAFQQTATQLETQFSTASDNVDNYLKSQCGIDTEGTDSASPTS
jgi:protein-tyrosine-phosphatase